VKTTTYAEPTEATVLAVFIAAGADPKRLAQWMHQNTDTRTPIDTLTRLGETLKDDHF
jgi:hypothetical protein